MEFHIQSLKDKIEFFEAESISKLEKQIEQQIEANEAILLEVHSVSHQMHVTEDGRRFYSAVVHFKARK